jgi:hypothetical protein
VLALYPVLIPNPYYIHLAETILIYAILLFGLDIVVGYTGQVSLGHAGLFGIGSYVTGVLVIQAGRAVLVPRDPRQHRHHGAVRRHPGAAGAARDRPLPGDGDAGLRHHHPDPDQRDDLPHRRAARHQDPKPVMLGQKLNEVGSITTWSPR